MNLTILSSMLSNKDITNVFGSHMYMSWKRIAIAIGVFLIILLLRNIFTKYVIKFINKISVKAKININSKILNAFQNPLKNFFLALGLYIMIITFIDILGFIKLKEIVRNIFKSSIVIFISQGLFNLTCDSDLILNKIKDTSLKEKRMVYSLIGKILRLIIVLIAIAIISEQWKLPIKTFIASLGIGGVVFALAAKDTAANVVAGVMIIFDKAFSIGDWIECNGIEGEVEDISFRSTKIRTVDKVLITVPNSTLANTSIFNFNRRNKRRVNFYLGVTYSTSKEKVQLCVKNVKAILENNENVSNDDILVAFENFNDSSLDIKVSYYITNASLKKYLEVKEQINFEIMDYLNKAGIDLAFPSKSIYIENNANND